MTNPSKKKKVNQSYDRLNTIFESIVNEGVSSSSKVDESLQDIFQDIKNRFQGNGDPTAGMTSNQKREYKYFIQNFIGNITSHIERMMASGVIPKNDPKANDDDNAITTYLTNTYFPSYLKKFMPLPATIDPTYKTLVKELGKKWKTSGRNTELNKLGGLVFNLFQIPQSAAGTSSGGGQSGNPPSGGQSSPSGNTPSGRQPNTYKQLVRDINTNWATLDNNQKTNLKNLLAGKR